MTGQELLIISINARGLNDDFERIKFFQHLSDLKADIVCIQETKLKFSHWVIILRERIIVNSLL